MEGLVRIYESLYEAYGKRNWWPAKTPFEMMVGAILTQNTTWSNVEKAIANLGDRISPDFIKNSDLDELSKLIYPSGFYKQKAIKLKALATWFESFENDIKKARQSEGEVLRKQLLLAKGIGKETADSILVYALNKPFFIIDAYTRRILYRIGYDIPKDYDDLRNNIESSIPKDLYLYNEFHALIVNHAKEYCKKVPRCDMCCLKDVCSKRA